MPRLERSGDFFGSNIRERGWVVKTFQSDEETQEWLRENERFFSLRGFTAHADGSSTIAGILS